MEFSSALSVVAMETTTYTFATAAALCLFVLWESGESFSAAAENPCVPSCFVVCVRPNALRCGVYIGANNTLFVPSLCRAAPPTSVILHACKHAVGYPCCQCFEVLQRATEMAGKRKQSVVLGLF